MKWKATDKEQPATGQRVLGWNRPFNRVDVFLFHPNTGFYYANNPNATSTYRVDYWMPVPDEPSGRNIE